MCKFGPILTHAAPQYPNVIPIECYHEIFICKYWMIWYFGDSYVEAGDNKPWVWTNRVASYLGCESKNFGVGGSSLEYSYCKFNECKFAQGDYIVIALTGLNRRYFVYDDPRLSSMWTILNPARSPTSFDRNQRHAVELFFRYLDNQPAFEVGVINFLYRVQLTAQRLQSKVIVFECFYGYEFLTEHKKFLSNIHFAKGDMYYNISKMECVDELLEKELTSGKMFDADPRLNHMCRTNHEILADKIISYYSSGKAIELSGFKQHILTWDNYKNSPEFYYE